MWQASLVFAAAYKRHDFTEVLFRPMAAIIILFIWVALAFRIRKAPNTRQRIILISFGLSLVLTPSYCDGALEFASADFVAGVIFIDPFLFICAALSIAVMTAFLSWVLVGLRALLRTLE